DGPERGRPDAQGRAREDQRRAPPPDLPALPRHVTEPGREGRPAVAARRAGAAERADPRLPRRALALSLNLVLRTRFETFTSRGARAARSVRATASRCRPSPHRGRPTRG